ncbi:MAG: YebC/PmpR family DNA-binding transcriptional regulator, partial [Bacteroidia bacterium]|nr:YebC/PmpR family DNA-binding transcriptional regulator [Bacteroidia bacterium]
ELSYEGYTAGGVAVFVECTTDNQNRTISNIRSYFTKYNGNLATNGSVEYLFSRKGVFNIPIGELDEEDFTLDMIDAGSEDVELVEDIFIVTTALEDFGTVQKKLEDMSIDPESVELQRIPTTTTKLDADVAQKAFKLIELIEDDEDVKAVFHNMELTDEIIAVIE